MNKILKVLKKGMKYYIVLYISIEGMVVWVRENYNSIKYWDSKISENKTIRGHMFMQEPPTNGSLYFHSLIFSSKNGIDNMFSYFPSEKALLGYIQYSFLQEAFYKWIKGKEKRITKIPAMSVEEIVKEGLNSKEISKEEAKLMLLHYEKLESMWRLPKEKIVSELIKFSRVFNKTWFGNNKEFLYLKILKTTEELGDFVVSSALIVGDEASFKSKTGVTIEEWKSICKSATKSTEVGEHFKNILQKNLTEII